MRIKTKQDIFTNPKECIEKFEIQMRRWRLGVALEAVGNKFYFSLGIGVKVNAMNRETVPEAPNYI